jgi:acyl dehydratase
MTTVMRYWQDLQPGENYTSETLQISREDILEFAAEFDPQPYHLDNKAAEESIFGGLCASGWQVSALMMRLLTDTFRQQQVAVMGVAAVPRMRWKIPVFADDILQASITLDSCEADSGRTGLGTVLCQVTVRNQRQEPVINLTTAVLVEHAGVQA